MFQAWKSSVILGMILAISACALSAHAGLKAGSSLRSSIPILLYHHIEEPPASVSASGKRWYITPEHFEEQMNWLSAHGFHPISMSQWFSSMKTGETLPLKPIILTFDDGWKDQYTVVLPILKKHGFPATFFVITDAIGSAAYMTWDEVKAMSQAGMDIQSHTVSHARLSTLSLLKARREISESRQELQERLHRNVTVLAYPYGSFDEDVIALTKAAGYEAAVTVSGLNGGYLVRTDRTYTIDRFAMENGDDLASVARFKHFEPN